MAIGYFYMKKNLRWTRFSFHFRKWIEDLKAKMDERKQKEVLETQQEIDQILDKINKVGMKGLNPEEIEKLEKASRKMSRRQKKD